MYYKASLKFSHYNCSGFFRTRRHVLISSALTVFMFTCQQNLPIGSYYNYNAVTRSVAMFSRCHGFRCWNGDPAPRTTSPAPSSLQTGPRYEHATSTFIYIILHKKTILYVLLAVRKLQIEWIACGVYCLIQFLIIIAKQHINII